MVSFRTWNAFTVSLQKCGGYYLSQMPEHEDVQAWYLE